MAYHHRLLSQMQYQAEKATSATPYKLWVLKLFSRLSIANKLNMGFGVLVLLTFLVVGRNAWGSVFANRHIKQTQRLRVPAALASHRAQQELLTMSAHIRGYLITDSSKFRDNYYSARQQFEKELAAMAQLLETSDAEEYAQLQQVRQLYDQWRQISEELIVLSDQFLDNQPALKLFKEQAELSLLKINSEVQKLIESQSTRSLTEQNTALLTDLAAFQTNHALMGASLRSYLMTRTPDFRFEYSGKLRLADQYWETINADLTLLTPEQRKSVEIIESEQQKLLSVIPEMLRLAESDRYREDLFVFNTKGEPVAAELLQQLEDIVVSQQQQLEDELALSSDGLVRAQWQTLIGSFAALAMAMGMALLLRQKIADPIVRLTQASAQIMEGNLDAKTPVESQDEIGTLATTFNKMTGYLKDSHQELAQYNIKLEARKTELESKNIQVTQALDALQQTQAQLIQTEKMSSLGQMVAGIAHEINNPVSFIHGNLPCMESYTNDLMELVELYQQHYPQPNTEIVDRYREIEYDFLLEDLPLVLTSMATGTQRIRDIVLSLRNFSRLDESDMKQASIAEGLESTLLILQSRLNMQSFRPAIALTKHYENLPHIECYPGQLNQVFLNVIANAIDAIDETSLNPTQDNWKPKLTIEARVSEEATATDVCSDKLAEKKNLEGQISQHIVITVTDNADGMSTDVKQHVFDPFFTTRPVGKGTGMGLSVSHKIVSDRHNGQITCTSQPGIGSSFTIVLPCQHSTVVTG